LRRIAVAIATAGPILRRGLCFHRRQSRCPLGAIRLVNVPREAAETREDVEILYTGLESRDILRAQEALKC